MGIRKILAVRFTSIGDLVLTTPFFREAKRVFPRAEIHFITAKEFASLFAGNPHIDRLIPYARIDDRAEMRRLAAQIKQEDYDLVFDLHRSLRSRRLLLKALGPWPQHLNFVDKRSLKRNLLLSPLKVNRFKGLQPQREEYLKLLAPYAQGQELSGATELFPSASDAKQVDTILAELGLEGKSLVALGPSASFPLKCWPRESFLQLGLKLAALDKAVVLLGGPGDEEPKWIASKSGNQLHNLAGRLSLLQSAELLRRSELAISNDSAIVHFAEAMKTPVVAFFGPTVQEFGFAPFLEHSRVLERTDLPCRPCSRNGKGRCKYREELACLTGISVDEALQAASEVLAR